MSGRRMLKYATITMPKGMDRMTLKCDRCGRFARNIYPVYSPIPQDGPSHEACTSCHPDPVLVHKMDVHAEEQKRATGEVPRPGDTSLAFTTIKNTGGWV